MIARRSAIKFGERNRRHSLRCRNVPPLIFFSPPSSGCSPREGEEEIEISFTFRGHICFGSQRLMMIRGSRCTCCAFSWMTSTTFIRRRHPTSHIVFSYPREPSIDNNIAAKCIRDDKAPDSLSLLHAHPAAARPIKQMHFADKESLSLVVAAPAVVSIKKKPNKYPLITFTFLLSKPNRPTRD